MPYGLNRGSGGGGGTEIFNETPTGTINGVNAVFTLAFAPNPAASLELYKNGQLMFAGIGYTLAGNTITYAAGYEPQVGDEHRAFYSY